MHNVDCDPSYRSFQLSDIMKSREKDMGEEMRATEGGKGGWGMSFFFYLRPSRSRVLALPRASRSVHHSKRKACSQTNMLLR